MLSVKQRVIQAQSFAPTIVKGEIVEHPFDEYLNRLYGGTCELISYVNAQNPLEISGNDIDNALDTVGLKAIGTDGLSPRWMKLKDDSIRKALHTVI